MSKAAVQSVRCPLCATAFLVRSEEECSAHIASCAAFRKEYGSGPRAALIADFHSATAAVAAAGSAPPPAAGSAPDETLESACDAFAAVLLPLVAVEQRSKPTDEAIELVSRTRHQNQTSL